MNLQNATNVINFYGHSLGKAGYSYFQSIFNGVDLYESKTVLVFYYPYDNSNESKNEKRRNGLDNSTNSLLVDYGAIMDSKDHSKNLMHKPSFDGHSHALRRPTEVTGVLGDEVRGDGPLEHLLKKPERLRAALGDVTVHAHVMHPLGNVQHGGLGELDVSRTAADGAGLGVVFAHRGRPNGTEVLLVVYEEDYEVSQGEDVRGRHAS
jgi:hypothetical protein